MKSLNYNNLPVYYYWNKTAWMTENKLYVKALYNFYILYEQYIKIVQNTPTVQKTLTYKKRGNTKKSTTYTHIHTHKTAYPSKHAEPGQLLFCRRL